MNYQLSIAYQGFQVVAGKSALLLLSRGRPHHCLLYDVGDLLGRLTQHLVHVLRHGVLGAKVLVARLSSLGIGVKRGLILLEELLLHRDIVVSDAQNGEAVLRFLVVGFLLAHFRDQLVLDEDKSLHSVLKSELVLTHLAEDGADVQVNVRRVQHLEAIVN